MDYYNVTGVKDEFIDGVKENDLENSRKECLYDAIEQDVEYLKDDTKEFKMLGVDKNEDLERTAQILELCNMKKISKPVKFIKNPLDYVNQPVFLQKSEIKFSESSLFTLVEYQLKIVKLSQNCFSILS